VRMSKTILLICAAVSLCGCSGPSPENDLDSNIQVTSTSIDGIPRYREHFSGRGENEDGVPFSFHTYDGPNDERVLSTGSGATMEILR